ncbi:MAG: cupin domain-containing protein [Candidatus Omnitrophica bacterium]|nr:cupin domain-containing protein [Candidatus Omnitrophota bacterium]
MDKIKIEQPPKKELEKMGVFSWPIWEKEVSTFDWHYDDRETCYILEGNATVKDNQGAVISFGPGDLVTFPKGLRCVWQIRKPVRKHYNFG